MSRATISLPTPLSPVISTFAEHLAAWLISSSTSRIAALAPTSVTGFIMSLRDPRTKSFGDPLLQSRECVTRLENANRHGSIITAELQSQLRKATFIHPQGD